MIGFGRWMLLWFGLFAAFSVFFYTAPPLRLAARRGIGELLVGLNFGPLMTAGTIYSLTGHVSLVDFLIGLPIGLLITAVLWINQFPDYEADQATGKINLVVVLGKERARWGYVLLVLGAFVLVIAGVLTGIAPWGALVVLAALPIAISAIRVLFRHYADRALVGANQSTIVLHMTAGLLMTVGVLLTGLIGKLLM
jgi:1,4-dihydroxy-2-naphthoate octaprenyltransferase